MSMRILAVASAVALSAAVQAQHPVVQDVIDAMEIDSMIHYVEDLSGETMVDVGAGPELIRSRNKFNEGNAKAQAYLEQKLVQFGYTPTVQSFSTTGKNVIVTKVGSVHPEELMILCAHYDARPASVLDAPAADDDGSGTAALLEAARVLRDIPFEYTIVFGFWDEEEYSLAGSAFHAAGLASNDVVVHGVVNMDAIAYDGDGDGKARVHARNVANSVAISDTVFAVRAAHGIDLDLISVNPGMTYSDHASYWTEGFGAVLMIEDFEGDGNPHYHTPTDKVEFFDVPYYEKLAKLSVGAFASFAVPFMTPQGVAEVAAAAAPQLYAFPNPTSGDANAWLEVPAKERYRVVLLDALGRERALMHEGVLAQGKHAFQVPLEPLAAGSYVVLAVPEGGEALGLRLVRTP